MIARRDSLDQALGEIEGRRMRRALTIVVNRGWWTGLSVKEQEVYQRRAEQAEVELRADDAISTHFVEVRGADDGPPLSTERPI